VGEVDLLLAREVVGGGAALDVDGAVGEKRMRVCGFTGRYLICRLGMLSSLRTASPTRVQSSTANPAGFFLSS